MLIATQHDNGSIVAIKLQSGQEIVGKLMEQTPMAVTVNKPLVVDLTMDQSNKVAIAMTPGFVLGADWEQNMTINRSHITVMLAAAKAIKDNYIHTTTGIAVPRSGIIQ